MTRLSVLFAVLCMVCALGVVAGRDKARKLHAELEREEEHMRRLQTEFNQLQLEQRTLAAHGRVEKIARDVLHMLTPAPSAVLMLEARGGERRP